MVELPFPEKTNESYPIKGMGGLSRSEFVEKLKRNIKSAEDEAEKAAGYRAQHRTYWDRMHETVTTSSWPWAGSSGVIHPVLRTTAIGLHSALRDAICGHRSPVIVPESPLVPIEVRQQKEALLNTHLAPEYAGFRVAVDGMVGSLLTCGRGIIRVEWADEWRRVRTVVEIDESLIAELQADEDPKVAGQAEPLKLLMGMTAPVTRDARVYAGIRFHYVKEEDFGYWPPSSPIEDSQLVYERRVFSLSDLQAWVRAGRFDKKTAVYAMGQWKDKDTIPSFLVWVGMVRYDGDEDGEPEWYDFALIEDCGKDSDGLLRLSIQQDWHGRPPYVIFSMTDPKPRPKAGTHCHNETRPVLDTVLPFWKAATGALRAGMNEMSARAAKVFIATPGFKVRNKLGANHTLTPGVLYEDPNPEQAIKAHSFGSDSAGDQLGASERVAGMAATALGMNEMSMTGETDASTPLGVVQAGLGIAGGRLAFMVERLQVGVAELFELVSDLLSQYGDLVGPDADAVLAQSPAAARGLTKTYDPVVQAAMAEKLAIWVRDNPVLARVAPIRRAIDIAFLGALNLPGASPLVPDVAVYEEALKPEPPRGPDVRYNATVDEVTTLAMLMQEGSVDPEVMKQAIGVAAEASGVLPRREREILAEDLPDNGPGRSPLEGRNLSQ